MTPSEPDETSLPEPPADPLGRLRFWAEYEEILDGCIADAVEYARTAGLRWDDIGPALGITGEGARIRHHRRMLKRVADAVDAEPAGRAR